MVKNVNTVEANDTSNLVKKTNYDTKLFKLKKKKKKKKSDYDKCKYNNSIISILLLKNLIV